MQAGQHRHAATHFALCTLGWMKEDLRSESSCIQHQGSASNRPNIMRHKISKVGCYCWLFFPSWSDPRRNGQRCKQLTRSPRRCRSWRSLRSRLQMVTWWFEIRKKLDHFDWCFPIPIPSMYGISNLHLPLKNQPNVGTYTIHGWYSHSISYRPV